MGRRWSPFHSPQPDTSRSRKTTDTGQVYRVACPFTLQLSLVLINRPRRDGTLSWRWYTAAVGGIRTRDLAVASPAPYVRTTRPPRTESNAQFFHKHFKRFINECQLPSRYLNWVFKVFASCSNTKLKSLSKSQRCPISELLWQIIPHWSKAVFSSAMLVCFGVHSVLVLHLTW